MLRSTPAGVSFFCDTELTLEADDIQKMREKHRNSFSSIPGFIASFSRFRWSCSLPLLFQRDCLMRQSESAAADVMPVRHTSSAWHISFPSHRSDNTCAAIEPLQGFEGRRVDVLPKDMNVTTPRARKGEDQRTQAIILHTFQTGFGLFVSADGKNCS